jgi:transcriptional regulator with XRE-family HTH domain
VTPAARIGRNIRRVRRAAEMSQATCAEWAGIHRNAVTRYESGECAPRLETLIRIAGALRVEPALLLEGVRWVPGVYGLERFVYEEGA